MEELDLFFEYEKHDTVEEFQLNFTPFILQIDHKNEAIDYLIKLFNEEKEQLTSDKRQETDERYLIQLRGQIRKTKNIITYLKSQYVKEAKEKTNKTVKIIQTDTCLKEEKEANKKQKEVKKRKTFSQETVELASVLKDEANVAIFLKSRNIKLEVLNEVLSYLNLYSHQLIHQKIQLRNEKKYDSLAETQTNINKYRRVIKELIEYKESVTEDKKSNIRYQFPIDVQKELNQHLQHLTNVEDKAAALSSIINIYHSHLELERQKYQDLMGKKEEIISHLSQNYTKEQIENQISIELKEIENNIKYLTSKYRYYCNLSQKKTRNKKRKSQIEFADEITIDDTQKLIKELILEGKELVGYENNDILYALAHCIKHDVLSKEVLFYIRKITNEIIHEKKGEEEVINGIYYIQDALKFRLANTPKEEIELRKILKEIQAVFDSIIKGYKQNDNVKQNDSLFNLIDYFLESEDYFQFLQRIVEKVPEIVNIRHRNEKTNTNEHIIIYIVDKYINNYQKLLENKENNYINPDYLKSIYFLFTKCYKLHLTKEEKNTIDNMLANFMRMVNKSITSSNRKYAVKMDLKEMYTDKFYFDQKWYIQKEIDEEKLDNEINNTFNSLSENIYRKNQIDCTDEHTVTLTNGYHAYSIIKKDDQTILKIHVVDLYNSILPNSELSKYIFNQSLMNLPIDDIIIHNFSMIEGGIYPTITFEIIFNHKGNYKADNKELTSFQIYKSKVRIAKKYSKYDIDSSKKDPVLETYEDLYRKLDSKNNENHTTNNLLSNLEDCFEKTLNEFVIRYFQEKKLPFIYSGIRSMSEKDSIDIRNNTSHLLNGIEASDFDKIYRALTENVDAFHYSTEYFEGEYQLPIMNPLSYPGLLIQNILHELVIDNKHNQKEYERAVKKYTQEFEKAISYLNYYNNYIDSEALKANKGKLVKVKKILF